MDYYTKVIKDYAVFSGRARRKEYWMFALINLLISIGISIVAGLIGDKHGLLSGLYSLAVLIPGIAVSVRRLHDIGKSGWWLLLILIPIIGWIVLLVFAVTDSQPGANAYGANPKEGEVAPPATPVPPVDTTPAATV